MQSRQDRAREFPLGIKQQQKTTDEGGQAVQEAAGEAVKLPFMEIFSNRPDVVPSGPIWL